MEAVIYFRNGTDSSRPRGWIILAPYSDCPTPRGYDREGADSLPKIDALQKILESQERAQVAADVLHDELAFGNKRDEIRQKLYGRMISSDCSTYEKEFLAAYLSHRIDRRAKWHAKFAEIQCYFRAREYDTPKGRRVDQEVSNVERIG